MSYTKPLVPDYSLETAIGQETLRSFLAHEFGRLSDELNEEKALGYAAIGGAAEYPGAIGPASTRVRQYKEEFSSDAFRAAGGTTDVTSGWILVPPQLEMVWKITAMIVAAGLATKDEEAILWLRQKEPGTGDLTEAQLGSIFVNNKQSDMTFSVSLARIIPADHEIALAISYGVSDSITIVDSSLSIEFLGFA